MKASFRCSERGWGRARRELAFAATLWLAGALAGTPARAQRAGASPSAPAPAAPHGRVEGEYGLWVEDAGDSVIVHWLTARPRPDTLVVRRGAKTQREATPAAYAHTAVLRGAGAAPLSLHYRGTTTVVWPEPPARPPVRIEGVDSIFVVGDVHGQFDDLVRLLRNAGVVDRRLHWAAGRAHLVLLGDLFDRGDDATAVLWLLYRLDHEAAAARGGVDLVLGNHELMIFQNDVRYVSDKELSLAAAHGVTYPWLFDIRRSVLGRWLASKPPAVEVDGVLFAHGGISADYLAWSLEELRDTLTAVLYPERAYASADTLAAALPDAADRARLQEFVNGDRSLFWYTGYLKGETPPEQLHQVLAHYGARALVVGHTPLRQSVILDDGQLLDANTFPFAGELVLLTRRRGALQAWRYRAFGPPEGMGWLGPPPLR